MDTDTARRLLTTERERLEGLRREQERLLEGAVVDDRVELSTLSQHPGDLGTDTFERAKEAGITEDIAGELAEVVAALERLDEGTYGRCQRCGRPIGDERLAARPATRYDVQHQAEAESEARA